MNPTNSTKSRLLGRRRLALLASAAGLGALIVFGVPSLSHPTALGFGSATAQAATDAALPHPAGFADIVAKVKPAVISVRVQIDDAEAPAALRQSDDDQNIPFAPGSPMQKFFQQFGNQFGSNGQGHRHHGNETIIGEGSGFFISPDGYAVTNNHVVADATSVQVTTADGTVYKAKVVGTDPKTDLALIKVNGKNDFPYVKFANAPPHVGDWVIAVGNPFGLGGTVTAGIVSAEGRAIGSGPYDDYIQIDAPINKGNSGGPAFNVDGQVIGINTAIYSPSGGSVGIGFDIPAATAKSVIAQLKAHGSVTRGWLGVQIQPVTAEIADSLGLKKAGGAIVDGTLEGGPAARAGLKSGDVITAVNGTPVTDARDLARLIAVAPPNSSVRLDILRQGKNMSVAVTLAKMQNQQQASLQHGRNSATGGVPHLGLTVAPAAAVAGASGRGVVVTAVDPDGLAAEQGLAPGNVILAAGGKSVGTAGDVTQALRDAKAHGKHDILLRVKTKDGTHFVAMPLGHA